MDFTKIECISETCKNKHIGMMGAGGQLGGRLNVIKVKCPECGLVLMIIPMSEEYEYSITCTTEEERKQQRIEKAKADSELELAKTINRIKETGY